MLGEYSNAEARASRVPKGSILRPASRRRRTVAGFERRLRAGGDVPAAGQIVLRSANQILR
jgi:hypothetical protein